MQDETMSQDTAFLGNDSSNDTFNFPDETTPQDSHPEQSNEETDSPSEDKEDVEQKVPYSRFKKKAEEVDEYRSRIESLEQTLAEINARNEKQNTQEDVQVPREWIELYGDSETSKRAWKVQEAREQQLQERAVEIAIQKLKAEQNNEVEAIKNNEAYIDESLSELEDSIGRKITPKMEEEILGIVDEFSQTGKDGKYIAMMPFEKAYEIFELRNAKKGLGTQRARTSVADLTGNASEGDIDQTENPHKRGWDSWRDAI